MFFCSKYAFLPRLREKINKSLLSKSSIYFPFFGKSSLKLIFKTACREVIIFISLTFFCSVLVNIILEMETWKTIFVALNTQCKHRRKYYTFQLIISTTSSYFLVIPWTWLLSLRSFCFFDILLITQHFVGYFQHFLTPPCQFFLLLCSDRLMLIGG